MRTLEMIIGEGHSCVWMYGQFDSGDEWTVVLLRLCVYNIEVVHRAAQCE
jgi:hypothetical protein